MPSSDAPPVADTPPAETAPVAIPSHAELFFAFFSMTLVSFGGSLPWTRRMFVEQKRWMTAQEFNDAFALCQFLPGPNIVSLAAVFGWRMRGWTGAAAAWIGFLLFPFCLMLIASVAYAHYSDVEALRAALRGLASAAAGLLGATAIKMAWPILKTLNPGILIVLATGVSLGILRLPLVAVLGVLMPLSILLAWWLRR